MSKRPDRSANPTFKGAKLNAPWPEREQRRYVRARRVKLAVRLAILVGSLAAIGYLYHGQSRCEATHGAGSIHCVD